MAEDEIAVQKTPTDMQFNTTVMILGKIGHIQSQSFKLTKEEHKDPKVI